jgi:hypothetical protein
MEVKSYILRVIFALILKGIMSVTSGGGTANPSGAHYFIPDF